MTNKHYCHIYCGGKEIDIRTNGNLTEDDLIIKEERDRKIYFTIVGNNPKDPEIALVGLCPGYTQLHTLLEAYNAGATFLAIAAHKNANF